MVGDGDEVTARSHGLGDWMASPTAEVDSAGRVGEKQRGMCLV